MDEQKNHPSEVIDEKLILRFDDIQPEPVKHTAEEEEELEKIRKKNRKQIFICDYCENPFATKTTLSNHMSKGICLGKGFMCLRCFKVWRTPSELQRHQMADKKCKISDRATIRRDTENRVHVVIEQ